MDFTSLPIVNYIVIAILIAWNVYNSLRTTTEGTIGEAANTISILQADIKTKHATIAALREETAGYKATLVEKDHQIQLLSGVFQGGQTSALMEFMKNMTEAVKGFQEYIKGNNERMEVVMKSLNALLEKK